MYACSYLVMFQILNGQNVVLKSDKYQCNMGGTQNTRKSYKYLFSSITWFHHYRVISEMNKLGFNS
jgi:hypothetical protein